jgi:hypothetical protein
VRVSVAVVDATEIDQLDIATVGGAPAEFRGEAAASEEQQFHLTGYLVRRQEIPQGCLTRAEPYESFQSISSPP